LIKILILSIISILFIGCSTTKYLPDCNNLTKSDSTEYYVSGLMDHTELKKEWIKEEIKKENVRIWIKNYINRPSGIIETDSLSLIKINEVEYKSYVKKWEKIENKITPEDKIFYYSTPENYWTILAGQDGLVVIRKCKIMYVLILMQS
jgi:hypothetical protein